MRFEKLCEYSLACLSALGENANNLTEIERQGGLELILSAIQTHRNNKRHPKTGNGALQTPGI